MKTIVARPVALLLGPAMLAATFVTHQACAQSVPNDARQVAVHYSDLNLDEPQGVQRLYRRIKAAAQEVCDVNTSDFRLLQIHQRCTSNAISKAVNQVHSAQLRALYIADTQHGWRG